MHRLVEIGGLRMAATIAQRLAEGDLKLIQGSQEKGKRNWKALLSEVSGDPRVQINEAMISILDSLCA